MVAPVWPLYDRFAQAFDRDRASSRIERPLLRSIMRGRRSNAHHVLDLGCGTGRPIAGYLIDRGCSVTGVDAAPAMIDLCRERFPDQTWILADMRGLALGRRFSAIIAWDSFFHLPPNDQRAMFPVFRDHAAPGCQLLFSSGPWAGVITGALYGEPLFHASLTPSEYRRLLADNGFSVRVHRVAAQAYAGHTFWMARAG